jgi:hypothetical protein
MDCQVSALMGAVDEELSERAGMFSLVDELYMSKDSGCQLNESIITPLVNSTKFLKPHIISTKLYHQHNRVLEHSKGRDTTHLSGDVHVGLSFECCGQVNGRRVGWNKVEVITTPNGTQTKAFQGGRSQCKRGFS